MRRYETRFGPRMPAAVRLALFLLPALFTACATPPPTARDAEPIKAAFVIVGENGKPIVRVITTAGACPVLNFNDTEMPMAVRAPPATIPLRPTRSDPAESKPSAFPVLTCERALPHGAVRASVGAHALPLPKANPRRIVVIGDTGCRIKTSDKAFQACNDPGAWPFAQVAAAAAATHPDLVIHVGDYHYRENACPASNAGCEGSPWGYGWDTWDADLFTPARPLLAAAPWIVVRGNHESCNRAGQGWWRFLDPRPLARGRDCDDATNDDAGDYSEPYAVPLGKDTQFIVFDSSKVGLRALASTDPMYQVYAAQMRKAFELGRGVAHNFFMNHHPILGFSPDSGLTPPGVFPGNESLQSVLEPINMRALFPPNVQALIAGHVHLFQMVSFATPHPTQFVSGNAGSAADAPLPHALPPGAAPAPGALVESLVSTSQYGYMTMEREARAAGTWRVQAWDRHGRLFTSCELRGAKTRCTPATLP